MGPAHRPGRLAHGGAARLVSLAAVLLVGAACAGPGRTDGTLASVIAEGLRSDQDAGELTFTPEEARCVAEEVVDRVGEDRLRELGADREPLDELPFERAERRAVLTVLDGCVDLVGQIAAFLGDGGLPADVARCAAERYAHAEELQEALFGTDVDPELGARIDAVLDDAVAACSSGPPA